MRIGEAANQSGVSARSLRYYEQHGLLHPRRDERGWRAYSREDLHRVEEVRDLLDAGLPITAIRRLVGCLAPDGFPRASQISDDLMSELTTMRDRLDSRVRCLAKNRDALDAWLSAARRDRAGAPP